MCGQGAVEVAVEGLVSARRTRGAGLDFGEVDGAFESWFATISLGWENGVMLGVPFAGDVGACVGASDLFVAFEAAGSAAGLREEGDGELDE